MCLILVVLDFFQLSLNAQLTYKELKVEYDSAWTYKNLQLVPVRFKETRGRLASGQNHLPALSLREAVQKHKIKLQEMQYEKGADINWLQLTNHSKQNIIIQSGEIVAGGKQDRMIAETKIIAPGVTDYIHVFCVEKRRWDNKAKDFTSKGIADIELRKVMDVKGRQNEVWKEIDRQFSAQKKTSNTWSYLNLYNDSLRADTGYINYFLKKYKESDSTFAGYLFITADGIISCELFSSPDLTGIFFNNLVSSYVHFSILHGSTPSVTQDKIKDFMDKLLSNEQAQKTFIATRGRMHLFEGKVIHLVAFAN